MLRKAKYTDELDTSDSLKRLVSLPLHHYHYEHCPEYKKIGWKHDDLKTVFPDHTECDSRIKLDAAGMPVRDLSGNCIIDPDTVKYVIDTNTLQAHYIGAIKELSKQNEMLKTDIHTLTQSLTQVITALNALTKTKVADPNV